MKIFLKLLPYLIIVALGFGIYGGFRYMSSELAKSKEQTQCLLNEKKELQNQVEVLKNTSNITIEQLEEIRKNEKNSLKYIANINNKIDEIKFEEEADVILMKINNYEICMAKNSLNPSIKCELGIK